MVSPTIGREKINTNDASDKKGNIGCGGIIIGNEGEWFKVLQSSSGFVIAIHHSFGESLKDYNLQQQLALWALTLM